MTTTCEHELRDGQCQMREGHRGRHSTVAFTCEACGKTRRGQPHAVQNVRGSAGDIDDSFTFCFMCCVVDDHRR
jgi:hypothetical protein